MRREANGNQHSQASGVDRSYSCVDGERADEAPDRSFAVQRIRVVPVGAEVHQPGLVAFSSLPAVAGGHIAAGDDGADRAPGVVADAVFDRVGRSGVLAGDGIDRTLGVGVVVAGGVELAAGQGQSGERLVDALAVGIQGLRLGRKNWLFAGTEAAGRRTAAILSLIESARLNGHDPFAYLRDVLARLPTHPYRRIDELLPVQLDACGFILNVTGSGKVGSPGA